MESQEIQPRGREGKRTAEYRVRLECRGIMVDGTLELTISVPAASWQLGLGGSSWSRFRVLSHALSSPSLNKTVNFSHLHSEALDTTSASFPCHL